MKSERNEYGTTFCRKKTFSSARNPENVFPVPLLSLLLGVLLINPYEKAILTDGFFLYKWNET